MGDISNEESKLDGPTIFGQKLSEIPCFRNSYLYGLSGGIATGLVYFMYSSKPRLSSHVGFTGFVIITLSYWSYCRYNWEHQLKNTQLLRQFMKEQQALEGTRQLDKENLTVTVSSA